MCRRPRLSQRHARQPALLWAEPQPGHLDPPWGSPSSSSQPHRAHAPPHGRLSHPPHTCPSSLRTLSPTLLPVQTSLAQDSTRLPGTPSLVLIADHCAPDTVPSQHMPLSSLLLQPQWATPPPPLPPGEMKPSSGICGPLRAQHRAALHGRAFWNGQRPHSTSQGERGSQNGSTQLRQQASPPTGGSCGDGTKPGGPSAMPDGGCSSSILRRMLPAP